jgi:hypothetical protein
VVILRRIAHAVKETYWASKSHLGFPSTFKGKKSTSTTVFLEHPLGGRVETEHKYRSNARNAKISRSEVQATSADSTGADTFSRIGVHIAQHKRICHLFICGSGC